ncbi:MAG: DNA methyltransferase [Lutibacter sp.]|jgi:DNA modification methylase
MYCLEIDWIKIVYLQKSNIKSLKQKRDRYEMHKYWGKKPSNDLKILIEKYSNQGDIVLDPFSGYGVFSCEAFLLNRNVISNDLNPIANFLNKQLLEIEIDLLKVGKEWDKIKKELTPFISNWFKWEHEGEIIQLITVLRNAQDIPIKGKFKRPQDRKAVEITLDKQKVKEYLKFELNQEIVDWYPKNKLLENSRISAKKDMTIPDLFTKRTLACHSKLLSLIEKHSSGKERDFLKVAFTANLANCSKLVPPIKTRGEMAPGAWMTGFYIGETYLENNVLQYFENRFKKIINGKKDYLSYFNCITNSLNLFEYNNNYSILQNDAKDLQIRSDSIDYIFTDPPYGDAVPYFEQSIIWNAWLKLTPDYENEIIITDSKERNKGINEFEKDIFLAFQEIRRVLKPEGYFSLTYHSLSGLEWKAITNSCIRNGFELVDFEWLVQKSFTPRQINRLKSVKGDVLVTFQKASSIQAKIKTDIEVKDLFIEKIENWLLEKPLDTNEIFLNVMNMIFTEKILIGNIDLFKILTNHFKFTESQKWTLQGEPEISYL